MLRSFLYAQRFIAGIVEPVLVLIFKNLFSRSERAQPPKNNFLEVIYIALAFPKIR
jgi:hypothetical protein